MASSVVPAIVVAAHNRPDELRRLCKSIGNADVRADTPLVISIDGGAPNQALVHQVAENVRWDRGPKEIIEHDNLGLVDHFYACGDLTDQYGSVVLLEDDLIVGPAFHRWATAALTFCKGDDRIAGASMATPHFDGYRHLPFEPLLDGSDGLYAQVPWYDGMAWTASMWQAFRTAEIDATTPIHRLLDQLDDDEWFPDAIRYLVSTGRYYLLPRNSHATNSGAIGAHFDTATNYFQVPLTVRGPSDWRLHSLDDSLAIYDDHLELSPSSIQQLVASLADVDFAVDLLGTRDLHAITATHVLTTREVDNPLRLWGSTMHPLAANLVHNTVGDTIRLAARDDVIDSDRSSEAALATLVAHANRGQTPSGRTALRQISAGMKGRLTRG